MTEITQADREVANRLATGQPFTCFDCADELTISFACHREQAERETVARIVAWLREAEWPYRNDALIAAIEAGEWKR